MKIKPKELTAGDITKKAIEILSLRNCEVWRSNNIPVRGRKFIGRRGASDVQGFHRKTGVAVYCEVKKIGDTLKEDQIEFLSQAKKAGCITLIATQDKETMEFSIVEFNTD